MIAAGAKEQIEQIASQFEAIGMQATVRPLQKSDMPEKKSEYADSDVIEADAAIFKELMDSKQGALVAFYAPWCGHCRTMVNDFKKAATQLKASGVRVAAVNSDGSPGLAQSLGIRGFPTVRWVSGGAMVDYKGPRQTMEMVQFAQQQNAISVIKGKVGEVAQGVKAMGKLAMSKVLGRAQASPAPEQMAQPPPAAAAA